MPLGQSMLNEFDMEMANTRKVLERIPDDKLDWKVHEKSNTIGWVANHLADIPKWIDTALTSDSLDIEPADGQRIQLPTESKTEAILAMFDNNVVKARQHLETVKDETLLANWSLLKSGETLMTMPRLAVVRMWVLNHSIHHRAHLCVYFRMNDIPVPGLYGPSADDPTM